MNWDILIKNKFIENSINNGIYCDVGACKGEYTDFFTKIAVEGKVFAFEINPKNYNSLLKYESKNCKIEKLAVTNTNGEIIDVYGNYTDDYQSSIFNYDVGYKPLEIIDRVETITLDKYFENQKVDFIKIDVEGAEFQVIQGALNTIRNCKLVIIECHFDEDWEKIHEFLKKNNLFFKNIVNDEIVKFEEHEPTPGVAHNGRPYQMYLINK